MQTTVLHYCSETSDSVETTLQLHLHVSDGQVFINGEALVGINLEALGYECDVHEIGKALEMVSGARLMGVTLSSGAFLTHLFGKPSFAIVMHHKDIRLNIKWDACVVSRVRHGVLGHQQQVPLLVTRITRQ
jgi:hypothetical protein